MGRERRGEEGKSGSEIKKGVELTKSDCVLCHKQLYVPCLT
jgi:hypothetical protein